MKRKVMVKMKIIKGLLIVLAFSMLIGNLNLFPAKRYVGNKEPDNIVQSYENIPKTYVSYEVEQENIKNIENIENVIEKSNFQEKIEITKIKIIDEINETSSIVEIQSDVYSFLIEACEYYGYNSKMMLSLIYRESSFINDVESCAQCVGWCQINKNLGKSYIENNDKYDVLFENGLDLTDEKQNIVISLRMLNYWSLYSDDLVETLSRYNWGWQYQNTKYADSILYYTEIEIN